MRFGTRHLLTLTFFIALIAAFFRTIGHLAIFAIGLSFVGIALWALVRRAATISSRVLALPVFVLSLAMLHVLSIGPSAWILSRYSPGESPESAIFRRQYCRIGLKLVQAPSWIRNPSLWYIANGLPSGTVFTKDWPAGIGIEWSTPSKDRVREAVPFLFFYCPNDPRPIFFIDQRRGNCESQ